MGEDKHRSLLSDDSHTAALLIPTFQKSLLLPPEIFSGIVHLNLVLICHNDPEFSGYQNDPTKLL